MNYSQALNVLYRRNEFSIKLGLHNIERLLKLLKNPHHNFTCIHIAGTNGKGSVARTLASILQEAGYRTGLYTSPHLIDFRERIQVNSQKISENTVLKGLKRIEKLIQNKRFSPTYFEVVTALAFDHFHTKKVDVAILETGLGGKWDSTNVCRPILTILTPIDKDHQKYLGNTLRKIAQDKAGIIKDGVPVVSSFQNRVVRQVIQKTAFKNKAPLFINTKNGVHSSSSLNGGGERFHFKGEKWNLKDLQIPSLGKHQIENATLSLRALERLPSKFSLSEKAIRKGLAKSFWPGRFHILKKKPLLILDGAHNVSALKVLLNTLKSKKVRNPIFVFGVMEDKEIKPMARLVAQASNTIYLVQAKVSKATTPNALKSIFKQVCFKGDLFSPETLPQSLTQALKQAKKEKRAVCVCGSLYIVGETLEILKKNAP